MKKLFLGIAVMLAFGMMASIAMAQVGKGLNGKHYNLNIIGVNDKENVGDSNGHTLFVLLNGHSKINMVQGSEFKVTDRNGTDGDGASFTIGPGLYDVYAVALGKPGGKVKIQGNAEFIDASGTTVYWMGTVDLSREKGKPQRENINKLFYITVTLCVDYDEVNKVCNEYKTFTKEWVFTIPYFEKYYWDYYNGMDPDGDPAPGVKLLQVRFYPVESDAAPSKYNPTTAWGAIKSTY